MERLAIITTHPIQYNAPLYKLLSQNGKVRVKIFYTWGQLQQGAKFDPGFGKKVEWDIPLLEGYEYSFVKNVATDPGSHHFKGIINPTLITEIEEWKANAILVFGWSFNSHLKCLRHFHKRIPILFRGDSTLLDEQPGIKKIVRRFFLKWVYRHVDVALFVGTQNKMYYLKHGLKESQLVFAPHAVDNDRFFDTDGDYAKKALNWRRQLNVPVDDMVFLFAGKLEPKKDPDLLIRAFEIIQAKAVHLIMVGNGILENDLKDKFKHIQNLHFIDFQNQTVMPVVYRLGDVFVLPSAGPGETWGLSVNEAMACERPVLVSTQSGCAVDLIEAGTTGHIFSAKDLSDLVKKMQLLLKDKNGLIEMGKHSLAKVKHWNFKAIAGVIENTVIKTKA